MKLIILRLNTPLVFIDVDDERPEVEFAFAAYANFKLIKFCDDDNVNTTAQLFNVSYVVMLPLQLLFVYVLVRNMDKKIQWRMR